MDCHHVGIATPDAAGLVALSEDLLDVPEAHEETFEDLSVTFLDCGGTYLELLEPLPDAEGPIPRYLDRHGPGLHHVAFGTDDVSAALERARELGIEPIDDEPRPGAWGHEVVFLHPGDTGGVLLEFVESGE